MSIVRPLVVLHRWAGVALFAFVALWFASGAVLHFVPFPALLQTERVKRAEEIDFSRIAVVPSAALDKMPDATGLQLASARSRPMYLLTRDGHASIAVAADTGELIEFQADQAAAIAEKFAGSSADSVEGPFQYDQWIVHQRFDAKRPYFRVTLSDAEGTQLYVSAHTGTVEQRTTARERFLSWPGAIVHWLYFTPLRKHWSAWDNTVWWLSLGALVTVLAGITLGIVRTMQATRSPRARLTLFRGWLAWHHVLGLFVSVFVLSWMFSGWLSMDHGRLFSKAGPDAATHARYRGASLANIAAAFSLKELQGIRSASEIAFEAAGGEPYLIARGHAGTHLAWRGHSEAAEALPEALVLKGLRGAFPAAESVAKNSDLHDDLYLRAEGVTPSAKVFRVQTTADLLAVIDPETGALLSVLDPSRRRYAWSYYAMHTLQFPGLAAHPRLRTVLILTLLTAGFAFSVTGMVIGVRRIQRTLA